MTNALLGGWSCELGRRLQGGQPITLSCPSSTGNGTGCYDIVVPGQDPKRGMHIDSNGQPSFFGNPAAFTQPCVLAIDRIPDPTSVAGMHSDQRRPWPLGGSPTQIAGPPFKRLDFSIFKDFQLSERFKLQFRAEFFNILNHPNFNAPGFGGNGVVNRFRVRQFHQLELRRSGFDSRCSLRSEADPVRSEVAVLS